MSNLNVVLARNIEFAPKGICGFSQTVAFTHYNNITMQLPIDVTTKELVSNDIKKQTIKYLDKIKKILISINHEMNDVVKLNTFLEDVKNIDVISKVVSTFFSKTIPAGRIVEICNIGKGALIQIDGVVLNTEGTPLEVKGLS